MFVNHALNAELYSAGVLAASGGGGGGGSLVLFAMRIAPGGNLSSLVTPIAYGGCMPGSGIGRTVDHEAYHTV